MPLPAKIPPFPGDFSLLRIRRNGRRRHRRGPILLPCPELKVVESIVLSLFQTL